MSTIKLARRSPRLMEKEATQKITHVFAEAGIPSYWAFDDALFKKRWEFEEMKERHEYALAHCVGCSECRYGAEDEEREFSKDLPNGYIEKEKVAPVVKALLKLAETPYAEMATIYAVALMRFMHGPGRILLKLPMLRGVVKAKTSELPDQLVSMCLAYTEMGERLLDACWAVAAIIHQLEDEDGYDIFMSY